MRRPIVGVMGPADAGRALAEMAFQLGASIARERWILLTGGRAVGVMDAASRGAKSVPDSITVGILPADHRTTDVSAAVDIAIFTNMGDARNAINVQSSDVVVALGAATPGTLSEVALALKAQKPVILLEAGDDVQRFLTDHGAGSVHVAADPADAIAQIKDIVLSQSNASRP